MGYKSGIETKRRIYQSAVKLFTVNGYYRTTMRMIAADAEVNLGLCTYHFKTKDTIVKTFYHHHLLFIRDYLKKRAVTDNQFQGFLTELALNYSLLFSSRLLLTLFLEGITADDLSRIYSITFLREKLMQRIPPDEAHDDSWYLMGTVVLSATSRAILRKWREKVLQRSTAELTSFLLHQFITLFEISGNNISQEIRQVIEWTTTLNLKDLEKKLIKSCLEEDFSDSTIG